VTVSEKYKYPIFFALIAGSTAAYVFLTSRWGFGTSPDSIVYIAAARSLMAGRGFSLPSITGGDQSPIVQFPPLFSGVLSIFGLVGIDPLDGASILNAVLLGLNIYLAGLFAYRVSRIPEAGFIAAALTLTAPTILTTHTMVWSEGLFLFLVLAAAFASVRYLEKPSWSFLLLMLPAALLAPLTRYVGVAVLGAAFLTIARRNLRHALILTLAASLGIGAWLARNYSLAADLANRSVVFHPPTPDQLSLGGQTVVEWFGGLFLAVVFVGLVAITILRCSNEKSPLQGLTFLANFALVYVAVIILSIFFADAHTPLDRRILSPLYLALSICAVTWIASNTARPLRFAWGALAVLIVALNSWTSVPWLDMLSNRGVGFSSALWRSSPTMQYLKTHKPVSLYTNAPDPIFLLTGVPAMMIPRHIDPGTRAANPAYASQMAQVKMSGGTVVYFRAITWRSYLPAEHRLQTELGLLRIAELGDGAVYTISSVSR
jgi:hypothetical protein